MPTEKPAGIEMIVSEAQFLKISLPAVVMLAGRVTLIKAVQPSKAEESINVTPCGIETLVIPVQSANAEAAICVTGLPAIVAGMATAPVAFLG